MSIRVTPNLEIEPVSRFKPASDAFTSNTPKDYGGGARLILLSVPRVRWLERPVVEIEPKDRK